MRRAARPPPCLPIGVAVALALLCAGGPSRAAPGPQAGTGARVLATVGDTLVVAMDAPGFSGLTREQRLFAYWLAQAAQAGDPIAWDQSYRHNVLLVQLLRGVLAHPEVVQRQLLGRVRDFARAVYLSRGLHDAATGRKLVPGFTALELRLAVLAAQAAGADFGLPEGVRVDLALRTLEGPLFDPRVDPLLVDLWPLVGDDPLRSSALNLYSGVLLSDLAGFSERYPGSSRLIKDDRELHEEVWRIGRGRGGRQEDPGLYSDELRAVADALELALPLAPRPQAAELRSLLALLRGGEPEQLRSFLRDWLRAGPQSESPGELDFRIGLVDTSIDPRALKGLFTGLVGFADPERSGPLRRLWLQAARLAAAAPAPEPAEVRGAPVERPAPSALVLLAAAGSARPLTGGGRHLPGEPPGHDGMAGRALLFPSVDDVVDEQRTTRLLRELAPPALADELVRCHPQLRFALTALHDVVGHWPAPRPAVARLHPTLAPLFPGGEGAQLLPGNDRALEEARAELVAFWYLGDPAMRELGLLGEARCQELLPHWAAALLLGPLAEGPLGPRPDDEQRAAALERRWFTERGVLVVERQGQKRYLTAPDPGLFRSAVAELIVQLLGAQASGDTGRLQPLLADPPLLTELSLRDELVSRLRALGLPRRVAVLPPRLLPVLGTEPAPRSGWRRRAPPGPTVVDATAEAAVDLDARILSDWGLFTPYTERERR